MRRAVLLVVVLALAACGGSGGTRLARDDYIARADAICAKYAKQQRALGPSNTLAGIPAYVDKALAIVDSGEQELRALRPPKDLEDGVDAWLGTLDETRDVLGEMKSEAERNHPAKVRAAGVRGIRVGDRRHQLARAIGLTACANG